MSKGAKGPFRADHVGSLLRPNKLQQARVQRLRKNITAEKLREIVEQSRARSAVYDVLTNGVPVDVTINTR